MVYVAVIGPGSEIEPDVQQLAWDVGRLLAERGAVVVTGGFGGVMAAATEGCADAGGQSMGPLPGNDRTGADGVIAVGGSWGTLSELALAQRTGVPVVSIQGWTIVGAQGGEQRIDTAVSAEEAVDRILQLIAPPEPEDH